MLCCSLWGVRRSQSSRAPWPYYANCTGLCLLTYSILYRGWVRACQLGNDPNISHRDLNQTSRTQMKRVHHDHRPTWKPDYARFYLPHQPRSPWPASHGEEATQAQAAVLKIALRGCGGVVPQHQTGRLRRTDGRLKRIVGRDGFKH